MTIQNLGRKTAGWVEIMHASRPDFFQFHPPPNYTETTTPSGQHVLRIDSLAPKQWFTLQFLCTVNRPVFLYINSEVGLAKQMPVMPVRRYPQWVYRALQALVFIGTGAVVYWLIRFGEFLLTVSHVVK